MVMTRARALHPWRFRVIDVLLFPVALLVVVLEDIVWVAARNLLRGAAQMALFRDLGRWLGTLPGWAALPLFAIPELLGRVGEVWAFYLLLHHHKLAGATAYIVGRGGATLVALFILQACEPALMRLRWFAWSMGRVRAVREWARARLAPAVGRLRHLAGPSNGRVALRFRAWRQRERRGLRVRR